MITWPNSRGASKLVQGWSADPSMFLGAKYLPDNTTDFRDSEAITWRSLAGFNGKAPLIQLGGRTPLGKSEVMTEYATKPCYIKTLEIIDEPDFIRIAKFDDPAQMQLAGLQLFARKSRSAWLKVQTQKEYLRWKAVNNALTAYTDDVTSVKLSVDYGTPAAVNATVAWATVATAKPMTDIRNMLRSYAGSGVMEVDMVINQLNANYLFANEEFRDLVRQSGMIVELASNNLNGLFKSLCQVAGGAKLRDIIVYDEGYLDSSGTFTRFIPDDRAFFLGSRQGPQPNAAVNQAEMLGEYANTPAMGEGGYTDIRPGDYMLVEDNTRNKADVRNLVLACGNNGLPVFYQPSWVKKLDTTASS